MQPRSVGGVPSACSDSPDATHAGALSMSGACAQGQALPQTPGHREPTSSLFGPWEASSVYRGRLTHGKQVNKRNPESSHGGGEMGASEEIHYCWDPQRAAEPWEDHPSRRSLLTAHELGLPSGGRRVGIKAGFTEEETKLQRIWKDSLVPPACQLTSRGATGTPGEGGHILPQTRDAPKPLWTWPPKSLFLAGSSSPARGGAITPLPRGKN